MAETCVAGGACVDVDVAIEFVLGELDEQARAAIEARIDTCRRCRALIAEAAREHVPAASAGPTVADRVQSRRDSDLVLAAGDRVERYVVERPLGAGGMGVVCLARDPELERPVVIKLVRRELATSAGGDAFEARLRREAQAMALLSHPNVVQIFDIGRHGDRVFLAMEFVDGVTFDVWLAETRRSVRAILATLGQAGAGLDAAHRAELVHRDIKPTNILVRRDGVVKVTDFGLARALTGETNGAIAKHGVEVVVTRADAVVGTPAYMSPEQAAGDTVDARTDQYAFALTLFDALLAQSPTERIVAPTAAVEGLAKIAVPPRIRNAIARALATDPADRFPAMSDLLRELEPRRRTRAVWGAVAGVVALSALAVGWFATRSNGGASCALAGDVIAREVPRDVRARLDAALHSAPKPGVATDVEGRLDSALEAWSEIYERTCPRSPCLEAQLEDLATQLDDAIEDHERGTTDLPIAIARWRDALGACDGRVDGSREYRHQLARSLAYHRQERSDLAVAAADAALALATDPITVVRAKVRRIQVVDNPTRDELANLPALYDAAVVTGDAELPGAVALAAANACPDTPCMERWTNKLADAVAHAPRYRSDLAGLRGQLALSAGKPAIAVALFEDEIHLVSEARGERSFELVPALGDLVNAHAALRQPDLAIAAAQRADDIAVWWVGADHPFRADTLDALGVAKFRNHDVRAAIDAFDRAIALRVETDGASSPRLAQLYNNLAACYNELGKPAQALPLLDLAIAATTARNAPRVATQIDFLRNSAVAASALGRADARDRIDRVFELAKHELPADHPSWTALYEARGVIERRDHQLDAARADVEQALAGFEKMGEVAEIAQIGMMGLSSSIAIERGDLAQARSWVLRATKLADQRAEVSRFIAGLAVAELALASGDVRAAHDRLETIRATLSNRQVVAKPRWIAMFHQLAASAAERDGDTVTASRERDALATVLEAADVPLDAARRDCAACTRPR